MPLSDGSKEDFGQSALRHYRDCIYLKEQGRLDNAGHLIGFSAECAIKHKIGSFPHVTSPMQHLPHLLAAARKRLGERSGYPQMYNLLKKDIFSDWYIDYRYSTDDAVKTDLLDNWIFITKRLLGAAGLKMRQA